MEKIIDKNSNKMAVLFFYFLLAFEILGLYVSMVLPYIFCRYARFVMTIHFNEVEYSKMY